MKNKFTGNQDEAIDWSTLKAYRYILKNQIIKGFNEKKLLKLACREDLHLSILYKEATYLLKGSVFMKVFNKKNIDDNCVKSILSATDFFKGQPIERNADYGFHQLAEVAIKALSPGVNDPATACN